MSAAAYLANPFFAALTSADEAFALSHGLAHRYQPDVIPFAAVREPSVGAFADLHALLEPSEKIFITTETDGTLELCAGLERLLTLPGLQMRFCGERPDEDDPMVVRLTPENRDEMLALKAVAFPGYFGPRAPELGNFFGVRENGRGRLISMGGERLATHTEREVSAVCTHPDFLGKGYAARVIRAVLRAQARMGTESILHVVAENKRAVSLYEFMGFQTTGTIDFIRLQRSQA
jgi:ribosomal protein S18 acetylase RimI-like enzyme